MSESDYRVPALERGLNLLGLFNARERSLGLNEMADSGAGGTKQSWKPCSNDWIADPEMMSVRRKTVEHPFGTLKHWMGATHFLTRTLPRASTQMSLHVLACNLKRLMSIVGVSGAMEALRA